MPTIFVTGGSGFVGTAVVDELVTRGHAVQALTSSRPVPDRGGKVSSFPGGLFDPSALAAALAGCDAAIHLVGIIMEKPSAGVTFQRMHVDGTKAVLDAVATAGVRRYVQMSALGTRPNADSDYHRTKWEAEELVRASRLDWAILRPSMIHGPGGEFMQMEAAWARRRAMPYLFMPYFGKGTTGFGGSGKLQPLYVGDVARAFADALEKPQTVGQAYELAGPDVTDWPGMHKLVAEVLTGKSRATLPIPAWYAKALTRVVPAALLPFNRAQVVMSQEDNVCDLGPFERAFGWTPRPFAETMRGYAGEL
jgi:uncharacterized protein YbjT (DUF2867 family)